MNRTKNIHKLMSLLDATEMDAKVESSSSLLAYTLAYDGACYAQTLIITLLKWRDFALSLCYLWIHE